MFQRKTIYLFYLIIFLLLSFVLTAPFYSVNHNQVEIVDLLARQNAKEHFTSKYELLERYSPALIIRRGATFRMIICLMESYKPELDEIQLEFICDIRSKIDEEMVKIQLTYKTPNNKDVNKWWAKIISVHDNQLLVEVHVSPIAAVSTWKLRISTKQNGSLDVTSFDVIEEIFILFNPWSKLDTVYMERKNLKQEYVLNDIGKIYIGTFNQSKSIRWDYGQFSRDVLAASMYILDKSDLDYADRSDSVKVVRAISQMVRYFNYENIF